MKTTKPVRNCVTQLELKCLADLERRIKANKAELAALVTQYNAVESPVMAALLEDVPLSVESGEYSVSVDWDKKRSPSYKGWIVKKHGEAVAQKILDETPESKTPYLVLSRVVKVVDEPVERYDPKMLDAMLPPIDVLTRKDKVAKRFAARA
jgi:hypothetical protein